jgi:hypothetical protein
VRHPSQGASPAITTVDEYDGGSVVRVSATQLGTKYSAYQARKIVDQWCELFAAGPTAVTDLAFITRTPKRLFASLRGQTQLRSLGVKWGDYDDLSPLTGMHELQELWLGGASSVRTLAPLGEMPQLRHLAVESLRHVRDLSPLGSLTQLRSLLVGGDWIAPRTVHVDSVAFLRNLPRLERLVLHTMIVDDLDYSPLLDLDNLKEVRVMPTKGMRPSHQDLCEAIPALEALPR